MQKIKSFFIVLFLGLTISACEGENTSSVKMYYDLEGWINAQAEVLNKEKPEITKNWKIASESESKKVKIADWKKELDIFIQGDINKNAFVSSYETSQTDSSVTYTLKPNEDLLVKSLTIKKLPNGEIKEVFIKTSTKNYLYENDTDLTLICKNGKLASYMVNTNQKLVFNSPKKSSIEGIIN
ncbi:hypothetical protein [Lacihabitans lacunae]|uniref:Lipoprotein n=1 Tax=Lacihabitans lacunae TaxID=1028214 RepID=A0ABV7YTV3_9BACT